MSDDDTAFEALLVIAAAGAVGDARRVGAAASRARAAGVSSARLEDTLLQLAPYAGFPRTIAAFQAAVASLDVPRAAVEPVAPGDPRTRGAHAFETVYADASDRVAESLRALHPLLARWIQEFAYGRVLARDGPLSLRERELLAVASLAALGGLDAPLLGHARAARRLGATDADLERAFAAAAPHAPKASGAADPGAR